MNNKFIPIKSELKEVKLGAVIGNKDKIPYEKRQSLITPLLDKLDVLKEEKNSICIYLEFNTIYSDEKAQKIIKHLSGQKIPNIIEITENECGIYIMISKEHHNRNKSYYQKLLLYSYFYWYFQLNA